MYNQKPLSGDLIDYGHPLSQDLVALWLFNEGNNSNKVYDLSGNEKNATAINGNSWVGGDISLNDQELFVRDGEYGALSLIGKDFTVVWSATPTDLTTDQVGIISQWGGQTATREWALIYETTPALSFYIDDGALEFCSSTTAPTVNVSETRAMVFHNGVNVEWYKDGLPDGIDAFAHTPTLTTPKRTYIGAWGNDDAVPDDHNSSRI